MALRQFVPVGFALKSITTGVAIADDTGAPAPAVVAELVVVLVRREERAAWRRAAGWAVWAAAAGILAWASVMGWR